MIVPRIAFVSDIHHGQHTQADKPLDLLTRFAAFSNVERPDLVIDLGDRTSGRRYNIDTALAREVATSFKVIRSPVKHLNGNHDRDTLSVAENEAILGQPMGHEVIDLGTWQVLLWRADTRIQRPPTGLTFGLGSDDLAWLHSQLSSATKPTVIATHVPLSGQSQRSNFYFHNNYDVSVYPEIEAIQAVLRSARLPLVCLSGHVHWNSVTLVDNIPHITLQSLGETWAHPPHAAGAWGMLTLGDMIRWQAYGRQHFVFETNAASTAVRGKQPLPTEKIRKVRQ
jgi:3',5'-cyclic-AMP phosphodiesterase